MKTVPVALIAVFAVMHTPMLPAEDSVKIYDSSREGDSGQVRTVQLSAPMVSFDIKALTSSDGAGDPSIAAVSINEMQTAPTLALNVTGPQFTLAQQPYTVELLVREADRKGFRARWELPGGTVVLTLVTNDDPSPVLYGRLRVERSDPFKILLLLAPGGYAPEAEERDRRVFTENLDNQHSDDTLPIATNWLLLYDTKLDPELSQNGKGAAGLLWNDMAGSDVSFQCGAYVSTLTVNVPAGDGENVFDFILWPFTGVPNESAKAEMKERAAGLLKSFSDSKERLFGAKN